MADINEMHSQTISELKAERDLLLIEKDEAVDNWLKACAARDGYRDVARKLLTTLEVRESMEEIREELR